jgi:transposase
MNKVRIDERKEHAALKNHKYTFLKNKAALSDKKRQVLEEMITLYPTLSVAYRLKSLFNDLWTMSDKSATDTFLNDWCAQVGKAKIRAFQKLANTLSTHRSGIIHFVESNISNAILESINSKTPTDQTTS